MSISGGDGYCHTGGSHFGRPAYLIREVLPRLESHGNGSLDPPAETIVLRQPKRRVPPCDCTAILFELRDDLGRELVGHQL